MLVSLYNSSVTTHFYYHYLLFQFIFTININSFWLLFDKMLYVHYFYLTENNIILLHSFSVVINGSWSDMKCFSLSNKHWYSTVCSYTTFPRYTRGVNLYGLSISLTDFCDLHGLTGVQCNPYGYL